ncbi:TEDC2 protein, partial [Oenanthe oenanthe]|nr:TEDC2 protein [Oenanthe oenanthe]
RPSPKELEELELLNRALEKALKVRKSILKTPLEAQGAAGQKGAAGKISSKGMTSKRGMGHRTATGACAAAEPQETPGLSESAPDEQQSFSGGDSAAGKNSIAAKNQLLDAEKKSSSFLGESSEKDGTAGAWGRNTSPGTGTLQEKGCQLKLPLLYRKAYSRNSRAWERCRLCQTSADAEAARTRFLERIQTTVSFPSRHRLTPSPAEIEEELRALQDVPSHLRQYVEAELADPPTLQGEYESLLTLEGLQSTVSQCLQKLQLLRADCPGDVAFCSPACVPARGQTCADKLAVPLLCYSSLQELRDLFALKLQVSMLHQEIALQKVMMAELLPVMEARPFLEGSAGLFRAIHTQLCQGGRRFPVLVRDELD